MEEKTIIRLFVFIGFIILAGLLGFWFFDKLIQAGVDIQSCKQIGYKGIKFVSKYSSEYVCSN